MFDFLKNITDKNTCQSMGICSIDPTVSAIEELLLSQARQASFYLTKLKEINTTLNDVQDKITKALSIVMINTSFDQKDFLNFLNELIEAKNKAKEIYKNYCKKLRINCELIDFEEENYTQKTISELIKIGEEKIQNKYNGVCEKNKRLFELITFASKTASINIEQLKKLTNDTQELEFEIIRFFSLTNLLTTRTEKLKRRICEFSKISFKLQKILNTTEDTRWGERVSTIIDTNIKQGKAILVSGPDTIELEMLLEAIGEREINVYTNSQMILAHTYPYFKKYKNLKGHLGSPDTQFDFANFPGATLITKNFLQKIDNLLRGTLYSNKIIAPNRVFKIKNNDYEPLIQAALKSEGYTTDIKSDEIEIKYPKKEIEQTLGTLKEKEVIIILGRNYELQDISEWNDKKIINLDCAIEKDLFVLTLEICEELNIKTKIFFTHCTMNSLNLLFSTLHKKPQEIYLTNCSSALINPHVTEAMEKDFNAKILR